MISPYLSPYYVQRQNSYDPVISDGHYLTLVEAVLVDI